MCRSSPSPSSPAPSSARWRRASGTCVCAGRSRASAAPHSSGHCYFGLKDDKAKIEAVIWRTTCGATSRSSRPRRAGGRRAPARHDVPRLLQVPDRHRGAGAGGRRRADGAARGAQEEARRRGPVRRGAQEARCPYLPRVVGIITSPTGAVIRDMLHGFSERFPDARASCGRCACRARPARPRWPRRSRLQRLASRAVAFARPDVLIVARGGGSLEDLWGFNEEIVVRAVGGEPHPAHLRRRPRDRLDADRPRRRRARADADQGRRVGGAEVRRARREHGEIRRRASPRRPPLAAMARTHLKAAARGLPRLEDLLALPRQRFDACEQRLARALLANTRAHHTRYVRTASRLRPGADPPAHRGMRRTRRPRCRHAPAKRCSTGSPRAGASSKARASCSLRSATRAFCSAASCSSAIATGAWCARQQTCTRATRSNSSSATAASMPRRARVRAAGARMAGKPRPRREPDPQVRRTRRPRGSGQGSLF